MLQYPPGMGHWSIDNGREDVAAVQAKMQLPLQLLYEPPVPAAFMSRAVSFIRDRLVLLLQTPFIMLREFAFVIPITLDNLLPKMPMVAL